MTPRAFATWWLAAGLLLVAGCSQGVSQAEVDSLQSELASATAESDALQAELVVATDELELAAQRSAEVTAALEDAREALTEAEGTAAASEQELATAASEVADARADAVAAEAQRKKAQELVAQLSLAYDAEITRALATVSTAASEVACEWGRDKAANGDPMSDVRSNAVKSLFASSDVYEQLRQDEAIAAALVVADVLNVDPFGVEDGTLKSSAEACWQSEDKKQNAALYAYQTVLANAVFDAACTTGADTGSGGYWSGYKETAVFQDWQLKLGSETTDEYIDAVNDRFGSIEAFLNLPPEKVQAESDRCEADRDLIEPKDSGTWNVGEEIKAGTWKAFDVSDCYWARLATNGGIRANHFGDGLRLSVGVAASDGQFEISGCTFYYANP